MMTYEQRVVYAENMDVYASDLFRIVREVRMCVEGRGGTPWLLEAYAVTMDAPQKWTTMTSGGGRQACERSSAEDAVTTLTSARVGALTNIVQVPFQKKTLCRKENAEVRRAFAMEVQQG
jgi:hypothetical protein